jgi:hypothetical protein
MSPGKTFAVLICLLFASPAYGRFDPKSSTGGSEVVETNLSPEWTSPSPAPITTKTLAPPVKTIPVVPTTPVVTPSIPAAFKDVPNNPLAAPQNIDELLKLRMTEDTAVCSQIEDNKILKNTG